MFYVQKLSLVTLLTIFGATLSVAMNNSDDDRQDPFSETSLFTYKTIIEIDNPGKIYEQVLEQKKAHKTAWIIDVDGTITNEKDPSNHPKHIPVTPKGKSVENIKSLIDQGAVVILCSAWTPFNDTLRRLTEVGFGELELGNISESPKLQYMKLTTPNESVANLCYYKSGCVISIKVGSSSFYFRNKAFSLMLLSSNEIEGIEEIFFMDDSFDNHQKFVGDLEKFGLYSDKKIHHYYVTTPIEGTLIGEEQNNE